MKPAIETRVSPAKLAQMQVDAWDLVLKRDEAVTGLLQQLHGVLNSPTDGTPEQVIDRHATAQKLATTIHFKHQILGEAVGSFAHLMEAEIRHYRKQETGLLI
jgi:hypothetical protein